MTSIASYLASSLTKVSYSRHMDTSQEVTPKVSTKTLTWIKTCLIVNSRFHSLMEQQSMNAHKIGYLSHQLQTITAHKEVEKSLTRSHHQKLSPQMTD